MDDIFFFDTYAFFEIVRASNNYEQYLKANIITTKLNLFELYHGLIKEIDESTANIILDKYYNLIIDFDKETIQKAAQFKLENKKRNLSMTDCIGYITSLKLGIKFLTGDKEFENFENVEFVK